MVRTTVVKEEILEKVNIKKLEYYLKFCNEDNLEEAYRYFAFDRELKNILFNVISYIEDSIKAKIIKYYATDFSLDSYTDINNFSNRATKLNTSNINYHTLLLENFNKVIEDNNLKTEDDSSVPLDILIDYITFGSMSKLYNLLKRQTQKKISDRYIMSPKYLDDWLFVLTLLRNKSYHNQILLSKITIRVSLAPIDKEKYKVIKPDSIFAYILIIEKLIDDEEIWNDFKTNLYRIITKYKISLSLLDIDKKFFEK